MRKFLLAGIAASAVACAPAVAQFNGTSGIYALNGQTFGLTSTRLSIISGGAGYAVGDAILLTCPAIGAANKVFGTVTVGSVSGGAVTSVNVTSSGVYTALPSSGDASAINGVCSFVQASTSGAGTGAVISTLLSFNAAPYTTYIGPTNTAANNTALKGLSSASSPVQRLGVYTPGDSPSVLYTASGSACSLNSGAGDVGSQNPTLDGKCWIAAFDGTPQQVSIWGTKGNASVIDSSSVSIASGSAALTVVGGVFSSSDVGKKIRVPFAGASGATLATTILSVTDTTHVILATNASTAVSAVVTTVVYGWDDTTPIQSALNATSNIYLSCGVYFTTATLIGPVNSALHGQNPDCTQIVRTDPFGDTLRFGTSIVGGAGSPLIENIWFLEPQDYNGSITQIPYTSGTYSNITNAYTHLRLYGAQSPTIRNNYFAYMPIGLAINGGSWSLIENNRFWGLWDPNYANLQEGLANLALLQTPGIGIPNVKDVRILHNQSFGGFTTGSQPVTITSSCGTSTPSIPRNIGPKYGVYANDGETVYIENANYFGGQSYNAIYKEADAGSALIGWHVQGNKFDGGVAYDYSIRYGSDAVAGHYSLFDDIIGNEFNGEYNSKGALFIDWPGSNITAYHIRFIANYTGATIGAPIVNLGGNDLVVSGGNILTSYNALGTCATDANYAAGIYNAGVSTATSVFGNSIGGNGNTNVASPSYASWGIYNLVTNPGTFGPNAYNALSSSVYAGYPGWGPDVQTTVSGLSTLTCNTINRGKFLYVVDALSPTWNGSLTGGGGITAQAFCTGSSYVAR